MKTTELILAAVLGLAITGALAAHDQNPNTPQRPGLRGKFRAHMLHKADTDGDGKLNEAERKTARDAFENRQRQ